MQEAWGKVLQLRPICTKMTARICYFLPWYLAHSSLYPRFYWGVRLQSDEKCMFQQCWLSKILYRPLRYECACCQSNDIHLSSLTIKTIGVRSVRLAIYTNFTALKNQCLIHELFLVCYAEHSLSFTCFTPPGGEAIAESCLNRWWKLSTWSLPKTESSLKWLITPQN